MAEPRIVSNPEVMLGKPVIAGTRITVEYILEELAQGQSIDILAESHPTLTREGVQASRSLPPFDAVLSGPPCLTQNCCIGTYTRHPGR